MYTDRNFKTKKALKDAVAARMEYERCHATGSWPKGSKVPAQVTYYQPNDDMTGTVPPRDGTIYVEGPHYPEPHKWYAQCEARNGQIVKVK